MTRRVPRFIRVMCLPVLVIGAWVAAPLTPSGAASFKPYAATVAPAVGVSSGGTVSFTLTLKNDTKPQSLGSMNLTVAVNHDPSVLTSFTYLGTDPHPLLDGNPATPRGDATLVGNVIQVRNLALPSGRSATLSFSAQAPCTPGTYDWRSAAKQSNDFSGVGNDFTLEAPPATSLSTAVTGTCKLAFVSQPADAQFGNAITHAPLDTSGSPVQVAVQTQDGALVTQSAAAVELAIDTVPLGGTSTLSGTTTVNAVGGLATFCDSAQNPGCSLPSIGVHGQGYTLSAASAGIDTTVSGSFNIVDSGAVCGNPGHCQVQAKLADTTGLVSITAAPGDLLTVSVSVDTLACAGYTPTSQVVTFASTSASVSTVTITIDAASVHKPASQFQICFSSSLPFTDRSGTLVPAGGSGLLADCSKKVGPPCTVSRAKDAAGNVILTLQAPAGDPRVQG